MASYGGPADSGRKMGRKKEQVKKSWRCPGCKTECAYYWVNCPQCHTDRPSR